MADALNAFIRELTDSEILTADELRTFCKAQGFTTSSKVKDVATALVTAKRITLFQADAALKGQARMLNIGAYRVLDRIGAGGMGTVYRARHRLMNRVVALKMMNVSQMIGSGTDAAMMRSRFFREVEAAAKLSHKNIVTAHDAGEQGGIPFLAMEFVEGRDLQDTVRLHGPLSWKQAVNFTRQAAEGLQYAHDNGIIHRDIKPGNILLDNDGNIKIMDMGLARISQPDAEVKQNLDITTTGTMLGTAAYMPPEQAVNAHAADHRADIYALGGSLFFMMTGRLPFEGESALEVLLAKREEPTPRLDDHALDVPSGLQDVLEGMMAVKPEARYQSFKEVIADIDHVLQGDPVAPRTRVLPPDEFDQRLSSLDETLVETEIVRLEKRPKPTTPTLAPMPDAPPRRSNAPSLGLVKVGAIAFAVILLIGVIGYLLARNTAEQTQAPVQTASTPPIAVKDASPKPIKEPRRSAAATLVTNFNLRDIEDSFFRAKGKEWFASTDASSTGDGSRDNPMSLDTALAGRGGISGGDILWLKAGTYVPRGGAFRVQLAGTPDKPVHIRADHGQPVAVAGSFIFEKGADAVWLHGVEIAPRGETPAILIKSGAQHRLTSLYIHHAHTGIAMNDAADSALVYGCTLHDITAGPAIKLHTRDGFGGIVNTVIARAANHPVIATALTPGASPPRFEGNVVYDSTGPITIDGQSGGHLIAANNVIHGSSIEIGHADGVMFDTFTCKQNIVVNGDITIAGIHHKPDEDNYVLAKDAPRPRGASVKVSRANIGQPFAIVAICNWENLSQVAVNPSRSLPTGVAFTVLDPLAMTGRPVLEDTYAGSAIQLPNDGELGVFIVKPKPQPQYEPRIIERRERTTTDNTQPQNFGPTTPPTEPAAENDNRPHPPLRDGRRPPPRDRRRP